jgi:hypothetical protein
MGTPPDDLISRVGCALYGERWQTPLARELGVADRTVRRWVSGKDMPKPGVFADLAAIVAEHGAELATLHAALRKMINSPPV